MSFSDKVINVAAVGLVLLSLFFTVKNVALTGSNGTEQPEQVVKVELVANQGPRVSVSFFGSGVLIAQDKVLTAAHVVRGFRLSDSINVTLKDGTVREAKVVKLDQLHDLALLQIPTTLIRPINPGGVVDRGDLVRIGGFPRGEEYREVVGKVVGWGAVLPRSKDTIFKVNKASKDGMSGGPVISNGQLVGILFGSNDYSNCVSIGKILEFLNETP